MVLSIGPSYNRHCGIHWRNTFVPEGCKEFFWSPCVFCAASCGMLYFWQLDILTWQNFLILSLLSLLIFRKLSFQINILKIFSFHTYALKSLMQVLMCCIWMWTSMCSSYKNCFCIITFIFHWTWITVTISNHWPICTMKYILLYQTLLNTN
jgi:hypothetical protein